MHRKGVRCFINPVISLSAWNYSVLLHTWNDTLNNIHIISDLKGLQWFIAYLSTHEVRVVRRRGGLPLISQDHEALWSKGTPTMNISSLLFTYSVFSIYIFRFLDRVLWVFMKRKHLRLHKTPTGGGGWRTRLYSFTTTFSHSSCFCRTQYFKRSALSHSVSHSLCWPVAI